MPSPELEYRGTTKTLEANGASISNNAMGQADDATYDTVSDGGGYPHGIFALSFAYTTAPTENTAIDLYVQALDVDGTNDEQAPEASAYRPGYVCSFLVNNVGSSTVQYKETMGRDLPKTGSYYLFNNTTGQTINSGWTLKVTPYTRGI